MLKGIFNYKNQNLETNIKFINPQLIEKSSQKTSDSLALLIKGNIPVDLSFSSVEERMLKSKPFNISLNADNFNLGTLGDLLPMVKHLKGILSANITFDGTFNNLNQSGKLDLSNGGFLLSQNNLDYNTELHLTLDKKDITINNFMIENSSGTNQGGRMNGSGSAVLDNFKISSLNVQVNGDLKMLSKASKSASPSVYGDLVIGTNGSIEFTLNDKGKLLKAPITIKDANLTFTPPQSAYSGSSSKFKYKYIVNPLDTLNKEIDFETLVEMSRERNQSKSSGVSGSSLFNYSIDVSLENEATIVFALSKEVNQNLTAILSGNFLYEKNGNKTNAQGELKLLDGSTLEFIKTLEATGTIKFESELSNPYLDIVATYASYYSGNSASTTTTVSGSTNASLTTSGEEVAGREPRQRERPQQRWLGLACQFERTLLRAGQALGREAFEHRQRSDECRGERQLALRIAHQLERAAQDAYRVGIRVHPERVLGRPLVPHHGLVGGAAAVELRGDDRRVSGTVRERPSDPQMRAPPLGGTKRPVCHLTDAVVCEVVAVGRAVAHDPAPPQLIERADERVVAEPCRASEHAGGELAADRRRERRDVARGGGEPREPRLDYRLHARARGARPQRLDHEQRVSLRLAEQPLGLGVGQCPSGEPLRQHGGLGAREAVELDLLDPFERAQTGHELVQPVRVLRARGRSYEQPRVRLAAQQVVEELERLLIGPMQIVGDEEDRRGGGQERPRDRVEQPLALLVGGQRLRHAGDLGQDAAELAQPSGVEPYSSRRQRIRAQPRGHGPIRQRALRLVAPRLRGRGAVMRAPRAQLLGEPALADARLAGHEHEARVSVLGGAPQAGEPSALVGAADQDRLPARVGRTVPSGQQRFVRRACRGRWLDPELALQRGRASVVDPQRRGRVAAGVV